jgi:hypothetical protein
LSAILIFFLRVVGGLFCQGVFAKMGVLSVVSCGEFVVDRWWNVVR